ncbi:MAG: BamA/TamA family outer membrane protein [Acidobacteria bacterium]|nr:BamA/TamA family outer membrane protein [Acidobacteriota bacterium]
MRVLAVAVAGLLAAVPAARASTQDYVGRIIVDVRIQTTDGVEVAAGVRDLVETRVGEPLSMQRVRDTIDHFVGLGGYDDVRVEAAPAPTGSGVALTWTVRPIRRIVHLSVTGQGEVPLSAVRERVDERFGERPQASRAPDIAAETEALYHDHGYRTARVTPRLSGGASEGEVMLELAVEAGPRTRIVASSVIGTPTEPAARVLERLQIDPGSPYDEVVLQDRLRAYENRLRSEGYYEARVNDSTTFAEEESAATVVVTVDTGPRVRLVFAGDPVPSGTLESLVPVREERSVDEDLLEDAGRNIEAYLRERGYRNAQAPYARAERNGQLEITFTVARGPLHRVGTVSLSGNVTLPRAELEPLLGLARGDPFVDARVGAIAAAIEESYRVRGYERAAVKPAIEVLPEQTSDGARYRPVDVQFTIVEGPRTTVSAVAFEGAEGIDPGTLQALLSLTVGRPFYRPLLSADRDALERAYRNQGFLNATVRPDVTFVDDNHDARVAWTVHEGEQTRVDRILITGNSRTGAEVIRRELRIAPGDPLGADAIAESQRRLSQLGLFRRVRITDLPRTGGSSRDVLVSVEEAPATTITYGGGLEVGRRPRQSSDGTGAQDRVEVAPRGFFEISRRNLWGKNRSISFFSRVSLRPRDPAVDSTNPADASGYGLNDYRVTGTYREPRAFGTPGDAQLTAFLEQGIRASFTFNRRGVRGDYARRFARGFTATGRYTYDYTRLSNQQIQPEDRLLIDRLFPQVRLSTFFGAVLRDSRDDVLDPQRGTVLGVDVSVAARAYGSEVGFAKTFLQGFAYRRLPGPGFVLAIGARAGLAIGFPRDVPRVDTAGNPVAGPDGQPSVDVVDELPASERFFAGGDTTVRGFALDRLGTAATLDPQGFPQGGNGLLVFNVELRTPYWKSLGVVGFVDAGNVFERVGDIDVGGLRVATGFGLRYRSPIGPLRVDLGFKVNPRLLATGNRERGAIVHVSLGQAF